MTGPRLPEWLAERAPSAVLSLGRSFTFIAAASAALIAAAISSGALATVAGLMLAHGPVIFTVREPFQRWRSGGGVCSLAWDTWSRQSKAAAAMGGFRWTTFRVGVPATEEVPGAFVTPDFFRTLGVRPLSGRLELALGEKAVVVSYAFWRGRLGGVPHPAGILLPLGGENYRIAGVLPENFWFASRRPQIWAPLAPQNGGTHWSYLGAIVRLKPGLTQRDLAAELEQVRRLHWIHGGFRIGRVYDEIVGDLRPGLIVLLYAFAFVLAWALVDAGRVVLDRSRRPRLALVLRFNAVLLLKTVLVLAGLAAGWMLLLDPARQPAPGLTGGKVMLWFWLFCLVCCAAVYWCLLDHRFRCRVCLRRLRMPVGKGSWSTPLLNRPGTEYICPFGHGKLDVASVHLFGMEPATWTYYGDFWNELVQERAAGE